MRAVFVNCVAMEPKTNMQNRAAPLERAITVSEEQRRRRGERAGSGILED